ncbi:class I SAM-dependent methyltransferase [Micromonospora sp. NPDC047793]|uniref:class I SAM-dependent methyltransferase n=1 Tax=unclassified Micromonospora TaxID=2617518 RepID=UPI0010348764|nr:class I SAM-dependent methyltransferase [Verrucosispora sp. SN26_14.1]TBL33581.1 class I SAM-dependent methyltransferase [Verrucosispora sp. SN26_14.1]
MRDVSRLRTTAGLLGAPVRALVRRSPRLNAVLWDAQYALGMWGYLDEAGDGSVPLSLIETWAPQPAILDLGCGTSVNLALRRGRYRHYHGVDISRRAIGTARALRRPDASYAVADIRTYTPPDRYDAILLREVIYYLSVPEAADLLRRLPGMLTARGRILVQIYDVQRSRQFVAVIRDCGLEVTTWRPPETGDAGRDAFFVLTPAAVAEP